MWEYINMLNEIKKERVYHDFNGQVLTESNFK